MAIWESIREALASAHSNGREWLTAGEITREVLSHDAATNKGTINALIRFHCVNDPSKKHSPGLQYRANPLFITDDPSMHGKRYRLLTDQERKTFLAHPRDDLDSVSYARAMEWFGEPSTELVPQELDTAEEQIEAVPEEIAGTALLELHLQDYLHRNWQTIFPGLTIYDGAAGREYRTSEPSVGVLDFLCVDGDGNFVVVETKRDMAPRRAIGQILSYMGWVAEKLCVDGQTVRGILISGEQDDQLRMAAKPVPTLSLQTYEISFKLSEWA